MLPEILNITRICKIHGRLNMLFPKRNPLIYVYLLLLNYTKKLTLEPPRLYPNRYNDVSRVKSHNINNKRVENDMKLRGTKQNFVLFILNSTLCPKNYLNYFENI